mgnify:CR=1 FL=1
MKKIFFTLALGLLLFASCEETMITIPQIPPSTGRVVLMEEYSGGKCAPCAGAHAEIENLLGIYSENLIVVTMHTFIGGQGNPVEGSKYDFRHEDAQTIMELTAVPIGLPSGVIDRTLFDGEESLQVQRGGWAGHIAEDVAKAPALGLSVNVEYDDATRQLDINVAGLPFEDITGDVRLTLVITESGIVNPQYTDNGTVEDYVHNHIFRDAISAAEGDAIGDLTAEVPFDKKYQYTLPEEDGSGPWIAENCTVVAYISVNDSANNTKTVLQAAEEHLHE